MNREGRVRGKNGQALADASGAVLDWHRTRLAKLAGFVGPSILPICFRTEKNDPALVGSCVLLRIAEEVFLLTAAHVVDVAEARPLFLITDDGPLALDQGEQVFKSAFAGLRADDPLDLAVLRLTGATLRGIKGRHLIGIEHVDLDETCAPDTIYVALGYPLSKVKIDRKNGTMTILPICLTSRAKPDAVLRPGRSVPANFAVELDRENMIVGRQYQTGTHPRGMSGGPLLCFESSRRARSVDDDKLVGICIEYQESNRVFVATNITIFLETIRQHYPHLSAAIPQSKRLRVSVIQPPDPGLDSGSAMEQRISIGVKIRFLEMECPR